MDGYLSEEAQRACGVHRDACPACGHHDVQIRRALLALQALQVIEPSAGFRDRLHARLTREVLHCAPVQSRRVRWRVATTIVAASVALFLAASSHRSPIEPTRAVLVLVRVPERPVPQRPVPARFATIQTATVRGMTAMAAPGSPARFEALPRQGSARPWPSPSPTLGAAMPLRTVSYLGQ